MNRFYAVLCSILTLPVWGQTVTPPQKANRNEKLIFEVAITGNDTVLRNHIIARVQQSIDQNQWNIRLASDVRNYPDAVFTLHEDSVPVQQETCRYSEKYQLRQGKDGILPSIQSIKIKDEEDAAQKICKYIKKTYYTGLRPTYTTVFENKKEGYANYRIPSLLALPTGRLLAITEARGIGRTDCAENDIVLKYSDDEGRSWSKLLIVAESGKSSLNNPTAVYVEELNRVIVVFQEYPPKTHEGLTQAGYKGRYITRTYLTYSDDNGETWSKKEDVTQQFKPYEAKSYATGPGIGIRVIAGPDKGRILIPANVSGGKKGWYNYLIASDDLGKTWHILPEESEYGTNESQVVQTGETDFLINARCHRYENADLEEPQGWNPWNFAQVTRYRAMIPVNISGQDVMWYTTKICRDLPDPLCQGAIFRFSGLQNKERSRLLLVNAASQLSYATPTKYRSTPPMRMNGTVRISYDEGKTWKYAKRIYGDRFTEFQYSVLARLSGNRIGCFFEAAPQMRFTVFDLNWLTSGEDRGED